MKRGGFEQIKNYWAKPSELQDLKTLSIDLFRVLFVISTTVKCNDWFAKDVKLTVVEDGHGPTMGWDLFPQLGKSIRTLKSIRKF